MYVIGIIFVWVVTGFFLLNKEYIHQAYTTVQYYILLNLVYNFLYYDYVLWSYKGKSLSFLNHTFIELAFTFIVMPIAITIFIGYFPNHLFPAVMYVLAWSVCFTALEWVSSLWDMFVYDHGWSLFHSFWFNLLMFTMLIVHFKRPFIAIILSVPLALVLIWLFPFPLSSLN
ncbi:CBO0543 family protein [Pontibacillus salicampi]|uniref:CBO0543 family protein n=1 Tax=Pontibacillus salicampi TaxID=1449801 RepID=A0ABV6LN33_9BACI